MVCWSLMRRCATGRYEHLDLGGKGDGFTLFAVRSRGSLLCGLVGVGSGPRGDCAPWVTTDSPAEERTSLLCRTHEPANRVVAWTSRPRVTLEELVFGLHPIAVGVQPRHQSDVGREQQNSGWGGGLYHTICRVGATPSSIFLQRATFCEHGDKAGPSLGRCCRFTTPRARLALVPTFLSVCGRLAGVEPYGHFWRAFPCVTASEGCELSTKSLR